jgi:DNA-binding NarL/FixJ family response regulator
MSAEAGAIRILAVDDHALLREGIAGLVAGQSDMSMVAQASNGLEAIHQFRTRCPEITLMDLQMPEMNVLMQRTDHIHRGRAGRAGAQSRAGLPAEE